MSNEGTSKFTKWREKYGVLVIALSCLLSAITSWGKSWILTGILVLGVLVCGTIGIFNIKNERKKSKKEQAYEKFIRDWD
ncbi:MULTISPECIES: hypothetical protein [Bacillaceae]|uniref:Lipoprotein n=1 Tax=Oceanobacillus caeni TaxID=405946 RepID=A0ABR5MFX0_9BACI|nr:MULTISPECIES: hypothetical protein [Bacillaceae]KKE80107.1 hypothetical protein WH51_04175 [Bacilli bacterium VT-13-104]PZD85974.1 hypothetical protein DEJ64_08850 [Bacilli bacterium]KPH71305.1 hypothetical protein AFL42_15580 [Oceanobacillus caeni]MBU8790520.1 hypothetical protein [Oceanobacillus caeni]MED4473857.1 hypothetical protein [Oceanobacillus caeni]